MDELARRVGMGRSSLHRIENAATNVPRPDKMARVLLALELRPEEVAPALGDGKWGRDTLRWMQRHLQVADSGAAVARRDGMALLAVDPTGGTVQMKVAGSVDLDRLSRALRDAGYVVARVE